MQVRFWGVRGSVPWATPSAIGHGCNTPCLQVTDEHTGDTLILDAGSGIVGLGASLAGPPRELPILLTHYHWDHLQGLPFLDQLYTPGWKPRILAPKLETHVPGLVETLFRSPFFPVPADHLPNRPPVEMVEPGEFKIGSFDISVIPSTTPVARSRTASREWWAISSTRPTTNSAVQNMTSGSPTSRREPRRSSSTRISPPTKSVPTKAGATATGVPVRVRGRQRHRQPLAVPPQARTDRRRTGAHQARREADFCGD